jgi:hypothetical protein
VNALGRVAFWICGKAITKDSSEHGTQIKNLTHRAARRRVTTQQSSRTAPPTNQQQLVADPGLSSGWARVV